MGFIASAAENAIRSQLTTIKKLLLDIDNAPTHKTLQGKIKQIRIAPCGLQLKQYNFRISAVELETLEIGLLSRSIQKGKLK